MITGEITFQNWAQDNNTFWMKSKKFRQKWLVTIDYSNEIFVKSITPNHQIKNKVTDFAPSNKSVAMAINGI